MECGSHVYANAHALRVREEFAGGEEEGLWWFGVSFFWGEGGGGLDVSGWYN